MGWSVRERVNVPLGELGDFIFIALYFNEEI